MYANKCSPGVPNVEWWALECIVHYLSVVHSESGDSMLLVPLLHNDTLGLPIPIQCDVYSFGFCRRSSIHSRSIYKPLLLDYGKFSDLQPDCFTQHAGNSCNVVSLTYYTLTLWPSPTSHVMVVMFCGVRASHHTIEIWWCNLEITNQYYSVFIQQ